jgi:hypothetical protein
MVKRILKLLLPRVFLKQCFTFYNAVRIATIDRILFPEYKVDPAQFVFYRKGFPFIENNIDLTDVPHLEAKSYMEKWYDWTQEEYVLKFVRRCIIEPRVGWAIVSYNRLLYYSLGISRTRFLPKPYLSSLYSRRDIVHVSHAISLRDTGEENYFHFYNDILTKLYLLKNIGIPIHEASIIISKKLWDKEYFQYYLKHNPEIASLSWLPQDRAFIRSDTTIFCKALTHRKDLWAEIFAPFSHRRSGKNKIFVTRGKDRLRHLSNYREVNELFVRAGFTVVDPDQMTIEEQIEAFSSTEAIAAVHGAALTNMMFRNGPCKVLEIFPFPHENYLPFHYIMLAKMKGFAYHPIIGEKKGGRFAEGFSVDMSRLRSALNNFVSSPAKYANE